MIVNDLMNRNPAILTPQSTLAEALKTMADRKVHHIVVVESTHEVVGIISDQDLALFYDPVQMTEERWKGTTVQQIMTGKPVTIGSQADVREAARLLLKSAVTALPVVDNGILVGVLSDRDFTRHFARS
jgi:CBS domain-containing protein